MFDIIGKVFFSLLAVVGMVELFRALLFRMLRTGNPGRLFLVVSFRGHDDEAELALRSAAERVKWSGYSDVRVLCVDKGMDAETRGLCEMVCGESSEIILCSDRELGDILAR